jgi:hypothetical protein
MALMAIGATRRKSVYAVIPLLMMAAAIDLSRVRILDPTAYQKHIEPGRLTVNLATPANAVYLQFGDYRQTWFVPPDWPRFELDAVAADGGQFHDVLAANQVVGVACQGNIKTFSVGNPNGFDIGSQANYRTVVYRSNSLLRTGLSFLRKPC